MFLGKGQEMCRFFSSRHVLDITSRNRELFNLFPSYIFEDCRIVANNHRIQRASLLVLYSRECMKG